MPGERKNQGSNPPRRRLTLLERCIAGAVGAAALGAGGAATFTTSNSAGAGVMLGIGGLFELIAITGTPIRAATVGGNKVDFDTDQILDALMDPSPESRAALAKDVIDGNVPASRPVLLKANTVYYVQEVVEALTRLGAFVTENFQTENWDFDALAVYKERRIAVEARFPPRRGTSSLVVAALASQARLDEARTAQALVGVLLVVRTELSRDFMDSHSSPDVRLVPWSGPEDDERLRVALEEFAAKQ